MIRSVIFLLICLSVSNQLLNAQTTVKEPRMSVSKAVPELVQTASKKEENIQLVSWSNLIEIKMFAKY
jgi:hypothetical protein